MKTKLHLFLVVLAAILLYGCSTSDTGKLPAGDIDTYVKYKNEIATLHDPTLRTDSKRKFDAAMTLYKNIDFSFVRELSTLEEIFSARDAHLGKPDYEKQTIIYVYRYKEKRVRFVFIRYNKAIIHSECTDKIK
jgi:hypothetical protein